MYANGLGVSQDYTEAMKWYRKAAEQGDAAAKNNLAALAQHTDPYADSYKRGMTDDYVQQRETVLDLVRLIYFALGCKVFDDEADIYPLWRSQVYAIGEKSYRFGEYDKNLIPLSDQAKRDGYARASQSGACDYWHQHPEAVYAVRQAAQAARH
jgi:TPR repeat protein